MRLTAEQQQQIYQLVRQHLGKDVEVSLFGSRLQDNKRGGDVDLAIETSKKVTPMDKAALKLDLENALSLPVDLVVYRQNTPLTAFQALARSQARPIEKAT